MPDRRSLGKLGEDAACRFLASRGYEIVTRNFRCRLGELDIVCRQGQTVVFVEVRARSSASFGLPQESVVGPKERKVRQVAQVYLQQAGLGEARCRFDVVAVQADRQGRIEKVEHFPDAF
ncbi:MAG: YraN family protein [Clostridia bacterium]|nr:MAG: YraN family protein [Clostridia bacterium]